jgi:hypothetical protein
LEIRTRCSSIHSCTAELGQRLPFLHLAQADYKCQAVSDDMQLPVMHVFMKHDGKIFHFWGTVTSSNHVDGVAVLESHGLYAGESARHSCSATEFQIRVSGETLPASRIVASRWR